MPTIAERKAGQTPPPPPALAAQDARDLLALVGRTDLKGCEAIQAAQLEMLLNQIANEPAAKH
jgi:hypothetical protein